MYRHNLDPVALVFGALFSIVGLAFAFGRWTWLDLNGGWALAILLIALGLAGILGSALRARRAQAGTTLPTNGDISA